MCWAAACSLRRAFGFGVTAWRTLGRPGKILTGFYGPYFENNGIAVSVKKPVDRTLRYQMKYNDDGSWEESCQYGPEYEQKAARLCLLEAGQFAPYCGEDTKGIYVEAALSTRIVNQFPS